MVTAESNGVNKGHLHKKPPEESCEMNGVKWSSSSSNEKQSAGLNGSPDQLFAPNAGPARTTTFERRSVKAEEVEQRIRRQWYPILLLSIALNLFLLAAVFYIIYEADYYSESRGGFMWRSCLIIFVPLIPAAILLLWPFSDSWRERRDAFSEQKASPQWRHIVNIANALVSFVVVLCFLLFSAIPKYNRPVWMTAVDFSGSIPVPAVAMVAFQSNLTGAGSAAFANTGVNASLPEIPAVVFSGDETLRASPYSPDNGELYRERLEATDAFPLNTDAIIANSTLVQARVNTPLQFYLAGNVLLTYKPVNDPRFLTLSETPPTIVLAAFDPRLTLQEVMLCSIVQSIAVNSFAYNTLTMSVTQLSDPRRKMVRPQNVNPVCDRAYSLLETAKPPIALFDLSLTASQSTNSNFSQECREGDVTDTLSCSGGFQLMYGSQFVTTQVSAPGKSRQDIWIDCGAIVGAVQFFAWFLLVFFQE